MPRAENVPPMSQFMVAVAPTAAVAAVPSEPTMAISIYCTAVSTSSSSMVGAARDSITGMSSGRRYLFLIAADMLSPKDS